ncbi:hypothetical protein LOTGIDRAFT_235671 [Lottia gigantea]|uniref:F-box only protein 9 n=1 Tax=Lottia gigantea TaxID=225164 RepID=V3ZU41_LOTGI|nr:hypothetical protein LOTGIDRAFT_235671 [Lottia gigantea]ESO86105.1 hypothetical protein LOTGIDRAFT_235671 [Lottia gigantea]
MAAVTRAQLYSNCVICYTDNYLPEVLIGEEIEELEGQDDPPNLAQQLEDFRQEWKQELNKGSGGGPDRQPQSKEERAKSLYLRGAEAEQNGDFYIAVGFYKKAIQLVPDIEFKIDYTTTRTPRERQDSECSVESLKTEEEDLLENFQNMHLEDNRLCTQEVAQNSTHISELPIEVIMYILRWVVSSELDVRSLEILSQVCRGFYLCARDEELWKTICSKIWGGAKIGKVKKYGNYRKMYLERPHLLFNGCYISKTSYIRNGEQSLDSFYRPYHIIEYFRYVRLFSDGSILTFCTFDRPQAAVPKLRHKWIKESGLLKGQFKQVGNKVIAELVQSRSNQNQNSGYKYKRRQKNQNDCIYNNYHIEFEISSGGKGIHNILTWTKYYISTFNGGTNKSSVSDIDLTPKMFPPMSFSRVKSYNNYSEDPL